jgi:hypothetical protein
MYERDRAGQENDDDEAEEAQEEPEEEEQKGEGKEMRTAAATATAAAAAASTKAAAARAAKAAMAAHSSLYYLNYDPLSDGRKYAAALLDRVQLHAKFVLAGALGKNDQVQQQQQPPAAERYSWLLGYLAMLENPSHPLHAVHHETFCSTAPSPQLSNMAGPFVGQLPGELDYGITPLIQHNGIEKGPFGHDKDDCIVMALSYDGLVETSTLTNGSTLEERTGFPDPGREFEKLDALRNRDKNLVGTRDASKIRVCNIIRRKMIGLEAQLCELYQKAAPVVGKAPKGAEAHAGLQTALADGYRPAKQKLIRKITKILWNAAKFVVYVSELHVTKHRRPLHVIVRKAHTHTHREREREKKEFASHWIVFCFSSCSSSSSSGSVLPRESVDRDPVLHLLPFAVLRVGPRAWLERPNGDGSHAATLRAVRNSASRAARARSRPRGSDPEGQLAPGRSHQAVRPRAHLFGPDPGAILRAMVCRSHRGADGRAVADKEEEEEEEQAAAS